MDVVSYVIGKNSGGGGGNKNNVYADTTIDYSGSNDATIGFRKFITKIDKITLSQYTTNIKGLFAYFSNLEEIPFFDTSNVKVMQNCFNRCSKIKSIPLLDTSGVTDMTTLFQYCSALETVPVLNMSSAIMAQNMFSNCYNLSDEGLDNILQMCIGATKLANITLSYLGLKASNYPVTRIEALPHYQDFINAGCSIGY